MRKVLFAMLLAALVGVPAATAAPPDRTAPDPAAAPAAVPALVQAPQQISVLQLPDVKRTGGIEIGTRPGAATHGGAGGGATPLDCGACITTCWSVVGRNGPSDWSGHAYIYNHLSWCGNGAQVTYATTWQTYDQYGWYHVGTTYGPWWSGGCIGCGSISSSGYMFWTESIPLIGMSHNGTTWLTVNAYAYGASTAT